jgi:hypothetical protein
VQVQRRRTNFKERNIDMRTKVSATPERHGLRVAHIFLLALFTAGAAAAQDKPADTSRGLGDQAKQAAETVKEDAKAVAGTVADTSKKAAQAVADTSRETAHKVAEASKEAAKEVATAAKTTARTVGTATRKAAHKGAAKVQQATQH